MTYLWYLPFLMLTLLPVPLAVAANELTPQLRRLSTTRALGAEKMQSGRALARFYLERGYQPAWSDGNQLLPVADDFMVVLPTVVEEGLDPAIYHLPALIDRQRRFRSTPTPTLAVELDLLLSDAFMHLASDSLDGRVSPTSVDPKWHIPRVQGDPVRMLNQALASGRMQDSLRALLPSDPAYIALRKAWQDYSRLAAAGGWSRLKFKTPLRPGALGPEVTALRQRLTMTGDLVASEVGSESFDAGVEASLRYFQTRHGLTVDGIVGPATLAALNVPALERAHQLALNLERWRWLPRQFGERYLRVNLPAFGLELIEEGKSVLTMRVIVGRQVRQTPAFVGRMTYLVLNPYWEVPRHLAVVDLLPKIKADASYLDKEGIEVFTLRGTHLDPDDIDWSQYHAGNFPYHLRQRPGPKNALGQIKFIFPNDFNIYLHDTPSRKLFSREQRSFSSGCIRIEKPYELALLLLRGTALDSSAALEEALKGAVSEVVPLPSPLPVYILYWTAWVDADGTVNMRPDLYKRDHRLDVLLRQNP